MNVRQKSAIVLVITLGLGFVLGWYSNGLWQKHKRQKMFEEMRARRGEGRFGLAQRIEELIQPTDAQKDTVRVIVNKYHEKLMEKAAKDFEFIRTTIDSLVSELEPVLTEEQIKKLEDRRQFMHPRREGRPPFDRRMGKPPNRRPRDGQIEPDLPPPPPPDENPQL